MPSAEHPTLAPRFAEILGLVRKNNPAISRLGFLPASGPGGHPGEAVQAHPTVSCPTPTGIVENHRSGELTADGNELSHSREGLPVFRRGELSGTVWFESTLPRYFTSRVLRDLEPYAALVEAEARNVADGGLQIRSLVGLAQKLALHRDNNTSGHQSRIGLYAREMAAAMAPSLGLSQSFVAQIHMFAPLHDIGTLAISDQVLLKPGHYTPEEFSVMKNHPVHGQDMIDEIGRQLNNESGEDIRLLRQVVRHHHENMDGSGYPDGLSTEEIPLAARIVAVADVFDATRSPRPYKRAWSLDRAINYLVDHSGRKFDGRVVGALLNRLDVIAGIQAHHAAT